VLIGVGQLGNVTHTHTEHGNVVQQVASWVAGLHETDPLAVGVALGTATVVVGLRWLNPRLPGAILGIGLATVASMVLDLSGMGLRVVADLSPIPRALPGLTLPDPSLVPELVPLAVAVTVLSLVESTSIARSIAARSQQRLDLSAEVAGEGLANLTAAFMGGYPTTGSLSRSALNEREGASSRLAGVLSGVLVLGAVLLLGGLLNHTPIASLAGLLLVVAVRLIDRAHIRLVLRSHSADRLAFLGTLAGTFFLHLDQAIYLGVGLSVAMFLRRSQMLSVRDLVVDAEGRLREVSARTRQVDAEGFHQPGVRYCRSVHVMNVAGSLFFGAAGELQAALDPILDDGRIGVLVLRLKRARNLDVSSVEVLLAAARRLHDEGRLLVLVGMRGFNERYLTELGVARVLDDGCFQTASDDQHWFEALEHAVERGFRHVGEDHRCESCALQRWLRVHPSAFE
jgi:SulP family sulfate permease